MVCRHARVTICLDNNTRGVVTVGVVTREEDPVEAEAVWRQNADRVRRATMVVVVVVEGGLGRRQHKTTSLLSREYLDSIQRVWTIGVWLFVCRCVFAHRVLFKCTFSAASTRHR